MGANINITVTFPIDSDKREKTIFKNVDNFALITKKDGKISTFFTSDDDFIFEAAALVSARKEKICHQK